MDPRRSSVLGASKGGEESAEDEHGARGGRDFGDPGSGDSGGAASEDSSAERREVRSLEDP
jgi:hypothetical protein